MTRTGLFAGIVVAAQISMTGGVFAQTSPPLPTAFPYRIVDLGELGIDIQTASFTERNSGSVSINAFNQVACTLMDSQGRPRPYVWLPVPAYGLPAGHHDLIDLFGVPGFDRGAAFDLNHDGIVVGQLGGVKAGDDGSRAIWWDLRTASATPTFQIIEPDPTLPPPPPGNPGSQDWTRAMSVSEVYVAAGIENWQILVESWNLDAEREICEGGGPPLFISIADQRLVDRTITSLADPGAGPFLPSDGCWPSAGARDVTERRDLPGVEIQLVGASGQYELPERSPTPSTADFNALAWIPTGMPAEMDDNDPITTDDQAAALAFATDGRVAGFVNERNGVGIFESLHAAFWEEPAPVASTWLDLQQFVDFDSTFLEQISIASDVSDEDEDLIGAAIVPSRFVSGYERIEESGILWRRQGTAWSAWYFDQAAQVAEITDLIDQTSCEGAIATEFHGVSLFGWALASGFVVDRNLTPPQCLPPDITTNRLYLLIPATAWVSCAGDTNFDRRIDFIDLLNILASFGDVCAGPDCCGFDPCSVLDFDGSGEIDFPDLLTVLGRFSPDNCWESQPMPQNAQDCWDRYGSDLAAYEACIETIAGASQ